LHLHHGLDIEDLSTLDNTNTTTTTTTTTTTDTFQWIWNNTRCRWVNQEG